MESYFRAASGPSTPGVATLPSLVSMLLRPAPERSTLVGELPEPELAPAEDSDRFSTEHWRRADELLDLTEVPRRLSGLLEEARETDAELARLVALRVLHAYSPEVGAAVRTGEATALIAVDDGTPLDDPEFGGVDLLVATAMVSAELAEAADAATTSGPAVSDPDIAPDLPATAEEVA